jgi:sarcosine oxidase subunit gamma
MAAVGATAPGHYGDTGTGVSLQPLTLAAAWNVQGDLGRPALAAAVRTEFGIAAPESPNSFTQSDDAAALWLGPSSWLLIAKGATPPGRVDRFNEVHAALTAAGGALFDLTAARVAWRIAGPQAATVLNKGCPLDLDVRAFPNGSCAQSVLGHVNVLVLRNEAPTAFTLLVARSFARDAWHFLCASSAQYGYDVLPPEPFS